MPSSPRCRILIFDLGDVLFSWSPVNSTSIPPKTAKAILSSTIWGQYECGRLSEDECYRLSADKFSLNIEDVRQAVLDMRASIQPDDAFARFIGKLKAEAQGGLRIFAMSNISAPDYAVTRRKFADWSIFERVFTSAAAGMRKPDLRFFKYVLDEIKAEASSVVLVDDKSENVLAACSLGMNGIVFDDVKRVRQALRHFVSDPVSRGLAFLEARRGQLESENSIGQQIRENFTQLLILEATSDKKLVNYVHHPRTWNFFREKPIGGYPEDLDTTSIGLTVAQPEDHTVDSVMDDMLRYTTEDGIIMTYFDAERPRTDPIVCLNVLSLFYSRGRGGELAQTLEWVLGVLEHRAYLNGTRYYETAECFLFFASRLLRTAADASLHARLAPLLRERIVERAGAPGDALALSMRVLAGAVVGVRMERDLAALLPMQCEDGGWDLSWVYRQGSSDIKIGNRGLTTALALNAIAALESQPQIELHSPPPSRRPQSPSEIKRKWGFSVSALDKGVYAHIFPGTGATKHAGF